MLSKLLLLGILLFVLVSFLFVGSGRASSMMWDQTYGGQKTESAEALIQTSDGGFVMAGYTLSFGNGFEDFWVVRTDAFGNQEWNHTYGGLDFDRAQVVIETIDGGYAIAGYTVSPNEVDYDCLLVKTDSQGNMIWNQTYGGDDWDVAYSLIQSSDRGYVLVGYTQSFGNGSADFFLIKTDEQGRMEYTRTYGGESYDFATSFVRSSDGGYVLTGSTGSGTSTDCMIIKTDGEGNELWRRIFGGNDYDRANSVVVTSDGGFALAGYTASYGEGVADFWLVKTDGLGNPLWNKTFGYSDYDRAFSLVQTADGGYALAGYGTRDVDFLLVKTDSSGNMIWNQTYGGGLYDEAHALVSTLDGGYALAGFTNSFGPGWSGFWLVKTNEYGIVPEFPSWSILVAWLSIVLILSIILRQRIQKGRKT
jgi:regulation of enolase protein 1 (concanavalin A-like superfamily)